jgi:CubicO group peptidase (beta-lactamase class C family)
MTRQTTPDLRSRTTLANWRQAPFNQWAFHNVRQVVPTAGVHAFGDTWALPRNIQSLEHVRLSDRYGAQRSLEELFAYAHTDAFLVLHRGAIHTERYFNGMRPQDPHILMSVSKSVVATVAGILCGQGQLNPEAQLTDYIPELAGTGFAGATLQQLLDMRVGLDFAEDYYVSAGTMIQYRVATGWNPRVPQTPVSGLHDFLLGLVNDRPHGGAFQYTSPNSDLLGWVLERCTGRSLAELMSDLLWIPMGAEFDANITVDGVGGSRAAGGISMSLRDLARLGQTVLENGMARGNQVLPDAWVRDTTRGGDQAAWAAGNFAHLLPQGCYRNQWYQYGDELDAYCAIGIHGQFVYVAPASGTVIAHFASHPEPFNEGVECTLLDAFQGLARSFRED